MDLADLPEPIVQAPLAGGASTPALAIAVSAAGGLGFLAAGMRTPDAVGEEIAAVRAQTDGPFGVNLFVPGDGGFDEEAVDAYAERLAARAAELGVEAGEPRADDDGWGEKLALLEMERVPVVSFTFGCPAAGEVARLHAAGSEVWVSVTTVEEAHEAEAAGADALVVQGVEAGGHRASFRDRDDTGTMGLLPLLRLVARETELPLVAAGGIGDGPGVAAVLAGGAAAAQLGTAFLRTPEAGTSAAHRAALGGSAGTAVTRAYTGRRARGIVNDFMAEHSGGAPSAYPQVLHVTGPLLAAARAGGDRETMNLWAGEAYALGTEEPAGALVSRLGAEAREALLAAAARRRPAPG